MSSKRIAYLVLFIALVVLGFLGFRQIQQREEEARARKQAEAYAEEAKREVASAAKLAHVDFSMTYQVPKTYPRPRSAWRDGEKAFYESILSKGRFDVLVVPFQVEDFGIGRDIRSLMTAHFATAIAEASGAKVADPYLVARALGDGDRRFELGEIFRLANALGTKRIVVSYVGSGVNRAGPNGMRLTLHSYERSESEAFSEEGFGPRIGRYSQQPIAS